jgi:hypothetical protein
MILRTSTGYFLKHLWQENREYDVNIIVLGVLYQVCCRKQDREVTLHVCVCVCVCVCT